MSFKDIKGQDKAIQLLQRYIESGQLTGSYLFAGPEGIGKRMSALTLAKAVNCLKNKSDPCDTCASCIKIEKGAHPDIFFIGSEGADVKIESIRQLQNDIALRPYEAGKKVFIIDNAHNLTKEASNALLKTLEEPPKDSLIILITEKPSLLFKTIISRCKVIRFYPLKRIDAEKALKNNYGLADDLAHFLAFFSEGRLGNAIKIKEAGVFEEKNKIIDEFIFSRKTDLGASLLKEREGLRLGLNILAGWFRDIYMVKIGTPYYSLINLDRKNDLLKTMNRYSFSDLNEIFALLSDSLLYLEQNVNAKLLLSNLKVSMRG
jgi:DNA polymerase-3 subunit delta'